MFAPEPTLDCLPDSTTLHIMFYLDILSLIRLSKVSRRFHFLLNDKSVWKHVDLTTLPHPNIRKVKKIIKERFPHDLLSIKMNSNASSTVQKKSSPVITPDVLNELFAKCPNVKQLSLSECDLRDLVTSNCLLLRSPSLQSVSIVKCLTVTRWLSAAQWPILSTLSLAKTTKTSLVDLKIIGERTSWINSLVCLDLCGCYQVNDDGVRALTTLKQLRVLNLSDTSITNASLQTVSSLPSLCSLHVNGVKSITSDGIRTIPSILSHLMLLNVSNLPQVSTETISEIAQTLSKTDVIYDNSI